jgi:16S rRNA (uracil1498-N3)-methyltransferase
LIGPEGDFTAEEVKKAKNAGYLPISLGENRLRTETAALAACFVIHTVNGTI